MDPTHRHRIPAFYTSVCLCSVLPTRHPVSGGNFKIVGNLIYHIHALTLFILSSSRCISFVKCIVVHKIHN